MSRMNVISALVAATLGLGTAGAALASNATGPAVFVVEIARNDAVDRVTVDGATGKVLKVAPDDQEGEHHDGDHDQEDDD
jgi:hypothetical protein